MGRPYETPQYATPAMYYRHGGSPRSSLQQFDGRPTPVAEAARGRSSLSALDEKREHAIRRGLYAYMNINGHLPSGRESVVLDGLDLDIGGDGGNRRSGSRSKERGFNNHSAPGHPSQSTDA